MSWCLMSSDASWHTRDKVVTNAEARFNKSLRPRKPEGSLGRTAQDGHLDSHTAPELCKNYNLLTFYLKSFHMSDIRLINVHKEAKGGELFF